MKLSISTRLFLGFVIVMLSFAGVLVFALVRFQSLGTRFQQLGETYLTLSKVAVQMDLTQESRRMDTLRIRDLNDSASRDMLISFLRSGFRRVLWEKVKYAQTAIDRAQKSGTLSPDDPWTVQARERLRLIEDLAAEYESKSYSLFTVLEKDAGSDVGERFLELNDIDRKLSRELRLFTNQTEAKIKQLMQTAAREESSITWGVIFWTILVLALAVAVLVISQISLSPLTILREKLARIAGGDYEMRTGISRQDEVGMLASSIDDMAKSLRLREKEISESGDKYLRATTDLRRLNSDLVVQKNFTENIFRSISAAIVVMDERGRISNLNPAAAILWGTTLKEAAGKDISVLKGWERVANGREALERSMAGGEAVKLDAVALGEFSEPLVDLTITPLKGEASELRGVLMIGEDVTERVRTKQLLIHSERLAAVGMLAAQITHEIRNPLSSIGLNAELLEDSLRKRDDAEASRLLEAIQSEITRLAEITEEYLGYSKIPSIKFRELDVNETVESLAAFVGVELSKGNVTIKCECDKNIPLVNGDSGKLRQAFMNIVKNALESMKDGGELVIKTGSSGGWVRLEFIDTGKGIDEKLIPRIFDAFYSTKEEGFGLGLALTRQFIKEHGGSIRCESVKGKGSVFTVELPVSDHSGGSPTG